MLYIHKLDICGILLQTVEFIHNSDFWTTKVEKSAQSKTIYHLHLYFICYT